MSLENNIIHYGRKEDVPAKIALKAGELDLVYEEGFIRQIQLNGQEVIRMINHAVRDYNWGTVPLRIFDEKIACNADSFSINYQAEAKQGDIIFLWNCTILGTSDSSISFIIEGEALTAFQKNRIGFTVLHPIKECIGKDVLIKKSDGKVLVQKFPELISPYQPFFDIQSMEWKLDNSNILLEFSGDVFETEDQRNWTDASYKTYCTPLAKPFPVQLKKGDKLKQAIKLIISGNMGSSQKKSREFSFSFNKPFSLPEINIGQSSETESLSEFEIKTLKAINFDNYQVDIKLYEEGWDKKIKRAFEESKFLGFSLELTLFFNNVERELKAFKSEVQTEKPEISIINIFNKKHRLTQKSTIDLVVPVLRNLFPKTRIGAGTNAFFAELNRDRISSNHLDFLVYSSNPQVHAYDNYSLIETIEALPYTIRTARYFSQGKPIHISPITYKMRWNPNATGEQIIVSGQIPDEVDVRQMSLFGASWLLGTINKLLVEKPESITFFETVGLRGIMQSAMPLFPDKFYAEANNVYPLYFIFKIIMDHKSWDFYPIENKNPMVFTGLAFGKKGEGVSSFILANYSEIPILIQKPSVFSDAKAIIIDDKNILQLMNNPISISELIKENITSKINIPPFGIALIN